MNLTIQTSLNTWYDDVYGVALKLNTTDALLNKHLLIESIYLSLEAGLFLSRSDSSRKGNSFDN